jgi:16S rRNA (adenine1518-N6/adenine1519-N6)-dimethyltransferase
MHKYKKNLGQHFLLNPQINNKIVSFVLKDFNEIINLNNLNIFEIGPGSGALSSAILENINPKRFFMIEKDFDLENILIKKFSLNKIEENHFASYKNDEKSEISLYFQDVLKFNFEDFIINQKKIDINNENIFIIANLPYNISTKLLLVFFDLQWRYNCFDCINVLVQKEVAEKFLYNFENNKKNSGKLSILTSLIFEKSYQNFQIGPKNFTPPPKVDSSLIMFKKNYKINEDFRRKIKFSEFLKFLNSCFIFPRKTLFNNLKSFRLEPNSDNKNLYLDIFESLNINQSLRPEDISSFEYLEIFKKIKKSL